MLEQRAADAVALAGGRHVGVADQVHVAHRLDAHDRHQLAAGLVAPERDSGGDLALELVQRHVRLVPAVGRDHAAVCLGGGVDDRGDRRALVIPAGADGAVRHGAGRSWRQRQTRLPASSVTSPS